MRGEADFRLQLSSKPELEQNYKHELGLWTLDWMTAAMLEMCLKERVRADVGRGKKVGKRKLQNIFKMKKV